MQHNRILVLGCSGSGKTTFARRLGEITRLPVIHLDKLYLNPGWVESRPEVFDEKLLQALAEERWIMDGNYGRTLQLRLQYCDQVFYFSLPRLLCLWGILTRTIKYYGKTRVDVGDGCPERFNWAFIKYTWNFEKNQGRHNKNTLHSSGKPVVIFRSRRAAHFYIESIKNDNIQENHTT